jgi:hypothetical protein
MPVPTNEPPGPLTPWPVPPEVNEVSQTCDVTYCTVNEVTATRLMPFSAAASTTSMTGAPKSAACASGNAITKEVARIRIPLPNRIPESPQDRRMKPV